MLKTFTLSLGLVLALSLSGVSRAGGLFHHETYASAQGPVASPQCVAPSPQGDCGPACDGGCGAPKGCGLLKKCLGGLNGFGGKCAGGFNGLCDKVGSGASCLKKKFHHETYYTYEWVLKKTKHKVKGGCTPECGPVCETVHASGQYAPAPSPQAGYGSPQAYGSGQLTGSGQMTSSPAPVAATASLAPVGDVAPPAPEIAPSAPTPPPVGPQSRLLFSTPSGN